MLLIAARTCDFPTLTGSPQTGAKVCQQLRDLTIRLLQPLSHSADGEAFDNDDGKSAAQAGRVDQVATYINLATLASASEHKGASIKWWSAAWCLARELKLGKELAELPESERAAGTPPADGDALDEHDLLRNTAGLVTGYGGCFTPLIGIQLSATIGLLSCSMPIVSNYYNQWMMKLGRMATSRALPRTLRVPAFHAPVRGSGTSGPRLSVGATASLDFFTANDYSG